MLAQKMLAPADQLLRLRNAAIAHLESGDISAAHQELDRAIALAPEDAKLLAIRGALRAMTRDHRGAVADFHRIVHMFPQHRETWIRLGKSQRMLQEFDEAMYSFGKAIALDPRLADAWLEQAKALHKKRWYPEALAYYDQVLAIDQNCEEARLCQHAARLGKDYENAIEAIAPEWNDGPTIPQSFIPELFITQMETAYGVTLPSRYRRFLSCGEYEVLANKRVGVVDAQPCCAHFVDPRLRDVGDLLSKIEPSFDATQWQAHYPGFIPFATIRFEAPPERLADASQFFVLDTRDPACPILLCNHNGRLQQRYHSLEDFIRDIVIDHNNHRNHR